MVELIIYPSITMKQWTSIRPLDHANSITKLPFGIVVYTVMLPKNNLCRNSSIYYTKQAIYICFTYGKIYIDNSCLRQNLFISLHSEDFNSNSVIRKHLLISLGFGRCCLKYGSWCTTVQSQMFNCHNGPYRKRVQDCLLTIPTCLFLICVNKQKSQTTEYVPLP